MKKVKKIPQRKCIVCQDRDSKKELMRIVKNKEGEIFLDPSGRANGRGAYICKDSECLKKAIKNVQDVDFVEEDIELQAQDVDMDSENIDLDAE